MQQIYKRTPMPRCDFNKVALQFRPGLLFKKAFIDKINFLSKEKYVVIYLIFFICLAFILL